MTSRGDKHWKSTISLTAGVPGAEITPQPREKVLKNKHADKSWSSGISLAETIRNDVREEYYKWGKSSLRQFFFH